MGEGKPLFTEPREAAKRAVWMLAWETQLTSTEADRRLLNQFFPVMCARTSGLLGWSYCKLLPWQLLWFPRMTFGNSGAVREVKAKEGVSEWRRGRCSRGQRQHTKTVTFRARQLDGMGPVDKFMNYCGKPVTSEVAFGQTGCICLWSVDGGDGWHCCGLLERWRPTEQHRTEVRAHQVSLPGNNFPRCSNCRTSVAVQHLGLLLFMQSLFSF